MTVGLGNAVGSGVGAMASGRAWRGPWQRHFHSEPPPPIRHEPSCLGRGPADRVCSQESVSPAGVECGPGVSQGPSITLMTLLPQLG